MTRRRPPDPRQATLFDLGPPGEAPPAAPPALPLRPAPRAAEPREAPAGAPTPASEAPEALARRLDRHFGGRLASLVLTENRTRILSVRPPRDGEPEGLHLRLHRCFLGAPEEVLAAAARFAAGRSRGAARRRDLEVLRERFAARPGAEREHATPPRQRRLVLRPVGRTLDLRELRDELNRRFFGSRLSVRITWGRALSGAGCSLRRRGKKRSIRLGSYGGEDGVVRIHRALDRPGVPRYVVESVVYHELLHADLPPVVEGGRRRVHTPEFRRRERLFPQHEKARHWIEKNLGKLLRA